MYLKTPLVVVALLFVGANVRSQEKADRKPGDLMIEKYLAAETDKLAQTFLDGAKTLDAWQQKRPRLQREYFDMLGLWPLPEKTPLHATVTGTTEAHGVVVEKLHFQSKPGLYVTANYYRPKAVKGKLPTILYVCGHSNRGRDGNKSAHQDQGFWFANNGYSCLILDTLQLGEIAGIHHGTYGIRGTNPVETRFWWHSAGYTPAGVECWNGVRAIDFLLTRPEVDPDKIGVTGISGGGAATFWIAAADERVKVAVPVSGMSDLESYVKNKVVNGHCDCMFLYNTYQWDWTTIAALVAPRPLLFANSDNDPIFPMDGNRRIIAKLRTLYQMHGKPGLVGEYVSAGGHAYRPDLRIATFKFLNKHLKGDTTTPVGDSAQYKELPGKELRVFPTDADIPKDALNAKIDETFVPRAQVRLPENGKFTGWKNAYLKELRTRVFRGYPDKSRSSPAPDFKNALLVRVQTDELVLPWTKQSPPNYFERSHALLGHTVDEVILRKLVENIRRDAARQRPVYLHGEGQAGVVAAYAALLEPTVHELRVENPPTSHMYGPHFLGVLRVLDVPEALGLLAPTPLTIIGGRDPAFDRTEAIYRLAGAADKLTRK